MDIKVISDVAVSPNLEGGDVPKTCAYPNITVGKDGDLICLYRVGKEKHSYDGVLLSQRSTDMGSTWDDPVLICDKTGITPPESVGMGGALYLRDGSLLAGFTTTKATKADQYVFSKEGKKQEKIMYVARSVDNGQTWSEPAVIEPPPIALRVPCIPTKPLQMPNGDVMIALETYADENYVMSNFGSFSSDSGLTFGPFVDLGTTDPGNELNLCDIRFAVIGEKVLALLWAFREDDERTVEVHQSVSSDNGRTWSVPQPTGFVGQVTVPLGAGGETVIAASNYRDIPEGIRLWYSEDLGKTWQHPPIQMWDVEEERIVAAPKAASIKQSADGEVWEAIAGFTFGTPDMVRLPDGTFILNYYATVNEIIHIRACCFELVK